MTARIMHTPVAWMCFLLLLLQPMTAAAGKQAGEPSYTLMDRAYIRITGGTCERLSAEITLSPAADGAWCDLNNDEGLLYGADARVLPSASARLSQEELLPFFQHIYKLSRESKQARNSGKDYRIDIFLPFETGTLEVLWDETRPGRGAAQQAIAVIRLARRVAEHRRQTVDSVR